MKYFGIVGANAEIIDSTPSPACPADHIEMTSPRPTPDHVAQADGSWAIPPPIPEQIAAQMLAHVDAHLTTTANQRGYDSIDSASKYIGNTLNAHWAMEGEALRDWAVLVYTKCYEIQADVLAGKMAVPTTEELLAMLPDLVWPEVPA